MQISFVLPPLKYSTVSGLVVFQWVWASAPCTLTPHFPFINLSFTAAQSQIYQSQWQTYHLNNYRLKSWTLLFIPRVFSCASCRMSCPNFHNFKTQSDTLLQGEIDEPAPHHSTVVWSWPNLNREWQEGIILHVLSGDLHLKTGQWYWLSGTISWETCGMIGTLNTKLHNQLHVGGNPAESFWPATMSALGLLRTLEIIEAQSQEVNNMQVKAIFEHESCPMQVNTSCFFILNLNLLTLSMPGQSYLWDAISTSRLLSSSL